MVMIKRILLLTLIFCGVHTSHSQFIQPYNIELPRFHSQGQISMTADAISQRAIGAEEEFSGNVQGYRILIYSNSNQSARTEANFAAARARELMPELSTVVEYDNPFFRAYAGNCLYRIEAVRLLGILKGRFPNAVISTKQYKVSYFSTDDSRLNLRRATSEELERAKFVADSLANHQLDL